MKLSTSEEDYLKTIYRIGEDTGLPATTNAIAQQLETKPASVTDMMRKLSGKKLIDYEKYKGVQLSSRGKTAAKSLIRKHRLWEYFLVEKLKFNWDEVHDIAEQLEHIQSPELVQKLETFLDFPAFDPHGDPIPDAEGMMRNTGGQPLNELPAGSKGTVVNVKDSSSPFLKYLDRIGVGLGTHITIEELFDFDQSVQILIDKSSTRTISAIAAGNLIIQEHK